MPKRIMPLTDLKIAKTKPQKKPRTLFDGDGLYLLITPTEGKEKLLALGAYPAISLAEATTHGSRCAILKCSTG